jgi:hypothetical protein
MAPRAANLCGMPVVLDNLSKNPVVTGFTKSLAPAAGRRKKLSDIIPNKADWWRMYLDRRHQKEALEKYPTDPGSFYDKAKSPGFQEAMLGAYAKILDGSDMAALFSNGPLKFSHYQQLYDLVKSSVKVEGKQKKMRRIALHSTFSPQSWQQTSREKWWTVDSY